jgi:hypothetical protein
MGLMLEMENTLNMTTARQTLGRVMTSSFRETSTQLSAIDPNSALNLKCPSLSTDFVFGDGDSGRTFDSVDYFE